MGDVRGDRLRRYARVRSVEVRRGRFELESARSAVHVARVAAQSAGAQSVLRNRQQRSADAVNRQSWATAAPVSAVHRRHPAVCGWCEVAVQRAADHGPQAALGRPDVRRVVHLCQGRGNRDEPSGQLQHRGQLGAGVLRHQPPLRHELLVRASVRTKSALRVRAPRRSSMRSSAGGSSTASRRCRRGHRCRSPPTTRPGFSTPGLSRTTTATIPG